jgi:D-alanine-D-alanine ligase
MDKKNILVIFGGQSAEHEVSVITGLQVIENIDRQKFTPHALLITQDGEFKYLKDLDSRKDYFKATTLEAYSATSKTGSYLATQKLFKEKIRIDAAYLALHGGLGESGQIQGFLESLNIPYTSPTVESSALSMNKIMTKEVLEQNSIKTVPYARVFSEDVLINVDNVVRNINLKLPLIIKPAHFGSSIAINIAKTKIELKKYLLEASHVDNEILVEKLMKNFIEYNIAVRKINGKIETSEVEKPLTHDEILSFADKYQRGGKKSGGMASLNRELPAKISKKLKSDLQNLATKVFKTIRAKGLVRIDFMVKGKDIYVTEINPIPGSMAYYLWEASGISFKDQITDLIEQAIRDNEDRLSKRLEYKTDIIEKFVNQ